MRRLLNEDDITSRIDKKLHEVYSCPKTKYAEGYVAACKAVKRMLATLSPADSQPEIIQCKDCKHSIDFYGDGECYCRRPNRELDWIGDWNFYCGCAERKEE